MTTETQDLKAGDRVRVVLEGEVTTPQDGGFALYDGHARNGGNWINPANGHVVSVEKLSPPLPTTPGSVVRDGDAYFFTLHGDGLWYGRMGIGLAPVGLGDCTIVFDAGAGK